MGHQVGGSKGVWCGALGPVFEACQAASSLFRGSQWLDITSFLEEVVQGLTLFRCLEVHVEVVWSRRCQERVM